MTCLCGADHKEESQKMCLFFQTERFTFFSLSHLFSLEWVFYSNFCVGYLEFGKGWTNQKKQEKKKTQKTKVWSLNSRKSCVYSMYAYKRSEWNENKIKMKPKRERKVENIGAVVVSLSFDTYDLRCIS